MRTHVFVFVLTLCASVYVRAADDARESAAQTIALNDRLDARQKKIDMIAGYSKRLEGILTRAGFPRSDADKVLTSEQKMARILPPAHCDRMRLIDAITSFAAVVDVKVRVDWKSLQAAGIDRPTAVSIDLKKSRADLVLRTILDIAGGHSEKLIYFVEDGVLTITTSEQAAKNVVTRTYDITNLWPRSTDLQSSQEMLGRMITDTVAPDSWQDAGGTTGVLRFDGNQLIITQTKVNQKAVDDFLNELDINKQNLSLRAEIARAEAKIVSLTMDINKQTARCRSVGIDVPPPLDEALDRILPDMNFVAAPLTECVDSLQSESGQMIHVKWPELKDAGISGRIPITLSLHHTTLAEAVRALVSTASVPGGPTVDYMVENNTVIVSTRQDFDKWTLTRVYDARECLYGPGTRQEAVERLINFITTHFDPDSWKDNGGTVGSIRELQGQLIITQSRRLHPRIREYLDQLRNELRALRREQ